MGMVNLYISVLTGIYFPTSNKKRLMYTTFKNYLN